MCFCSVACQCVSASFLVVSAIGGAAAEAEAPGPVFSIQEENDVFAGTDRYYSQGLRLAWGWEDTRRPEWLGFFRSAINRFSPFDHDPANSRFIIGVGHSIFTPTDHLATALVSDDRPYAAWLYATAALQTRKNLDDGPGNDSFLATRIDVQDSFELQFGTLGPSALGKEIQNGFHDVIRSPEFNGWDNQIRDEPGFLAFLERKWRLRVTHDESRLGFDLMPHAAFSLGNVRTSLQAGLAARLGFNLPSDFVTNSARNSAHSALGLGGESWLNFDWGIYGFVSLEGSAVARNIFLDGNTFDDSHSVEKESFISDFSFGVGAHIDSLELRYSRVRRSEEFVGQDGSQHFGSLTLSVEWPF
jgi:hypothetical protein